MLESGWEEVPQKLLVQDYKQQEPGHMPRVEEWGKVFSLEWVHNRGLVLAEKLWEAEIGEE